MGSTGDEGTVGSPGGTPPARPRPDRLAEALRANLKRRKAQTRARDEVRPGAPAAVTPPGTDEGRA